MLLATATDYSSFVLTSVSLIGHGNACCTADCVTAAAVMLQGCTLAYAMLAAMAEMNAKVSVVVHLGELFRCTGAVCLFIHLLCADTPGRASGCVLPAPAVCDFLRRIWAHVRSSRQAANWLMLSFAHAVRLCALLPGPAAAVPTFGRLHKLRWAANYSVHASLVCCRLCCAVTVGPRACRVPGLPEGTAAESLCRSAQRHGASAQATPAGGDAL